MSDELFTTSTFYAYNFPTVRMNVLSGFMVVENVGCLRFTRQACCPMLIEGIKIEFGEHHAN